MFSVVLMVGGVRFVGDELARPVLITISNAHKLRPKKTVYFFTKRH